MVCLYLWCGLRGYWVSCAVEAGSQGDYHRAGNRLLREYTEAWLCPWPHFDQRPGPSCIRQAPRDQLALRGELLYSTTRDRIRENEHQSSRNPGIWLFTCSTVPSHTPKHSAECLCVFCMKQLHLNRFLNLFSLHYNSPSLIL